MGDAPDPMDRDRLRRSAADYAAGDLGPEEAAAFASLLASDADLKREVAFWNRTRAALVDSVPEARPDPFLGERVDRRIGWNLRPRGSRLRVGVAVMLAAACLLVGFGLGLRVESRRGERAAETLAWGDDGAAMRMPPMNAGLYDRYLPLAALTSVDVGRPHQSAAVADERAWLGVWTKPVDLRGGGGDTVGHLVVRVVAGSPAEAAGIAVGDVIVAIGDCPVSTAHCIANQIAHATPGQSFAIDHWQAATGRRQRAVAVLGAVHE
ncbi:MAG: PDZ domain-containing protein [Planctomycetes bacterium]|nr:PDZ domain-containing protein [Planctomycetota bacterium]